MSDSQQLQRAEEGGLRRRVQKVKAQDVGDAQCLELQHRRRQVAALYLRHRLGRQRAERRLCVQPERLAGRVSTCKRMQLPV